MSSTYFLPDQFTAPEICRISWPWPSIKKLCGNEYTPKASAILPVSSSSERKSSPVCFLNCRTKTSEPPSSSLTVKRTKGLPANRFCKATREGISSIQGGHQVAQKLIRTIFGPLGVPPVLKRC